MKFQLKHIVRSCLSLITLLAFSSSLTLIGQEQPPLVIQAMAYSPDGTRLAYGGGSLMCNETNLELFAVSIVDTETKQIIQTLGSNSCLVNSVSWSPDGSRLAVSSSDGTATIWDLATSTEVARFSGSGSGARSLDNLNWSPTGDRLVVDSYIWDAQTGSLLRPSISTGIVRGNAWSPDGGRLATANQRGQISIWDLSNQNNPPDEAPLVFSIFLDNVVDIAYSPDAQAIAAIAGTELHLFDATTGQLRQTFLGTTANLTDLVWSPDGLAIAAGGMDNYVRIWDVTTGELVNEFDHLSPVYTLDWHPNGHQIAFAGTVLPNGNSIEIVELVTNEDTINNFVALAQDGLLLQQGVTVQNGNIGVNTTGESPFLSSNSTLTIGQGVQFLDSNSVIYGDSIHLNQNAQVYAIAYNSLTGVGQPQGEITSPLQLPLLESLPPVPEVTVDTNNIRVNRNSSTILSANSYGSLTVAQGGTVTFTGGIYHFASWDLAQDARILYAAPSEIRIAQTLNAQQGIQMMPSPQASNVDASDMRITVLGTGGTGNPAQPSVAHFGNNSTIVANIYVPNGSLEIGNQSTAEGAFIGRYVTIGNGTVLSLNSGF